jgi:hypothetical protein
LGDENLVARQLGRFHQGNTGVVGRIQSFDRVNDKSQFHEVLPNVD